MEAVSASPLDEVVRDLKVLNKSLEPFGCFISLLIDERAFDPIAVVRDVALVPIPVQPERGEG